MHNPDHEVIALDLSEKIGHLRFKNAVTGNRVDETVHKDLGEALRTVQNSRQIRVLVISSEGRHFCAGADFDFTLRGTVAGGATASAWRERICREGKNIFYSLAEIECPVIAAVTGAAVGLGATIATMADIVVANRGGSISDPHVVIGLVAGDGGVVSWSQSIGIARAKRYLLTGDTLSSEEAYRIGLVTDIVSSAEEVLPAAMLLAERIAGLPYCGVSGTKKAFNALTKARSAEAFELGMLYEKESMSDPEVVEAVEKLRAKLSKRHVSTQG